jgi:tetratricopeptide (TPR) repeat protein
MIRFLSTRVARDPDDFAAQNRLAAGLLQRVRETNDMAYLSSAERAARASLRAVPAEVNFGGLSALAQVEFASHRFSQARDHARRLTQLNSNKSEFHGLLGDALLELGHYEDASRSYTRMWSLDREGIGTHTRLARTAWLHGHVDETRQRLFKALALALNLSAPPRETVAWLRWQLGETAFSIGDYPSAEHFYRDALITFPDDSRALAALGRVRAARGDAKDAIEQYQRAIKIIPDPNFVAALGDLYQLSGRVKEARAQAVLVEQIGHLSQVNGALYNRQLALFLADHNLKPQQAYADAKREYAARRDIYGADALAWTALKAGDVDAAQTAIKAALRLGTRDAKIWYHAGLIARAAGRPGEARDYLQRALSLNPHFDALQVPIARRALAALTTP